jgi:NAD(P)-dependent dehydrogenase (short-subunit alcohol dehydrogenase family)
MSCRLSEIGSTADLEAAERVLQVNLFGGWRMIQAFLPPPKRSADARIVNVSSGAGSYADPVFALAFRGGAAARYGISKAALECSDEHARRRIGRDIGHLNAVCPGLTRPTQASRPWEPAQWRKVRLGSCGRPRCPATAARWVLPRWKSLWTDSGLRCVEYRHRCIHSLA